MNKSNRRLVQSEKEMTLRGGIAILSYVENTMERRQSSSVKLTNQPILGIDDWSFGNMDSFEEQ